ncbi:MAG: helix-turn-helix transcriptional regulator [Candidatus Omnitrophica bacterium]|jgi:DNA-binding XRE family transcriptional regulator|nr:helix-turn-helix transcriptional regulator [Candidatus Omnitrophota bacterium]
MKGVKKFSSYLKEQLKNETFRKAYEEEGIYVDIAVKIALLRKNNNYSQKDLAKLLRTTQQTVSRLENPRNNSLSINTLIRLAALFKKELRIEFV